MVIKRCCCSGFNPPKPAGVNIVGEVREPGYLEGGDFCPASADLAFVGVGLRSYFEAVPQLMEEDLFGSRRVAVVRDDFEQNQVPLMQEDVCGRRVHVAPLQAVIAASYVALQTLRCSACMIGGGARPGAQVQQSFVLL